VERVVVKLQVGQALASMVDTTAVIVVRAPADEVTVTCGGPEMVAGKVGVASQSPDPTQQEGSLLGKRYVSEESDVELLCTKGGDGSLAVDGVALRLKEAKPLPASD
jgi:hypothetical protein